MRFEIETSSKAHKRFPLASENPVQVAELRKRIDCIDDEIIELIAQRIDLSTQIMGTKPSSQVIDKTREQAIIDRYFEKLSEASTMAKVKRLVLSIVGTSKAYPD